MDCKPEILPVDRLTCRVDSLCLLLGVFMADFLSNFCHTVRLESFDAGALCTLDGRLALDAQSSRQACVSTSSWPWPVLRVATSSPSTSTRPAGPERIASLRVRFFFRHPGPIRSLPIRPSTALCWPDRRFAVPAFADPTAPAGQQVRPTVHLLRPPAEQCVGQRVVGRPWPGIVRPRGRLPVPPPAAQTASMVCAALAVAASPLPGLNAPA